MSTEAEWFSESFARFIAFREECSRLSGLTQKEALEELVGRPLSRPEFRWLKNVGRPAVADARSMYLSREWEKIVEDLPESEGWDFDDHDSVFRSAVIISNVLALRAMGGKWSANVNDPLESLAGLASSLETAAACKA